MSAEKVYALLNEANRMPNTNGALSLLEEAVRVADLHNDLDLAMEARRQLMWCARNLLRGDILTTAFVWCLAQYDRDPERYSIGEVLAQYRMVIGQLANQHDISRTTLDDMLADLGRRIEAAGFSKRSLYFTQRSISMDLGDLDLARASNTLLKAAPRDLLSYDGFWEQADEVEVMLFLGEEDQAIALAEPFIKDRYVERGKTDDVCSRLLAPFWKRGWREEAKKGELRCRRSFNPQRVYYWWFGEILKFAVISGDLGRAVKLYEQCQRAIYELTDPLTRLHFGLDALVVLDALRAAGQTEIAVSLPKYVPVPATQGRYPLAQLRDWLGQETELLAKRFDARNGNGYFQGQFARIGGFRQ